MRARDALAARAGGIVGNAIGDSASWGESTGLGDLRWTVTLEDIVAHADGTADVTVRVVKEVVAGSSGGNSWSGETFVNGELVTENPDGWIVGAGEDVETVTVDAVPGDRIRVTIESENTGTVRGTVPEVAFDPAAVVISDCTVMTNEATVGDDFTIDVAIENDNTVPVTYELAFTWTDVETGEVVDLGRLTGLSLMPLDPGNFHARTESVPLPPDLEGEGQVDVELVNVAEA